MSDILHRIVGFTDIDPDESATLPHRLNVGGVSQTPDLLFVDNVNFSVIGDDTSVTVKNNGGVPGNVNVLAINWHTFLRVFGVEGQKSLAVRPYIPAGVAGEGGNELVKVSADDATPGFLLAKIVQGPNITLTELSPGENEGIEIKSALQFQDEGVQVAIQPALNVVGPGASIVNDPANNRATLTVPGGLSADGAVVKRSKFKSDTVSTSGSDFVDGMSGSVVTVPMDGSYCAEYEGESKNQSGSGVIEIGISVNSVLVTVLDSTRGSQGNANDIRPSPTSVELGALVAGDVVRMLLRKSSGAGSVEVNRRNLTIIKTQ